ncbi:MAG: hypothetical protein U5R48_16605 [Gammaproteobacteria bacterium]|nr:hypothetical protein [Gammaproteobacteria bacterium]
MKRTQRMFAALALAVASLITAPVGAEGPVPESPWGADDTLGAVNRLSPAKVLEAAKLIRTGRTYPLGVVTGYDAPPIRRAAIP